MDQFIFKLISSSLVGGLWVGLTTFLAERFGSRLGGFIGGLPSTIVISLYSIAWSEGAGTAYAATTIMPLALACNTILLTVYAFTVQRLGFRNALFASLCSWALPQSIFVIYDIRPFLLGLLINMIVLVVAFTLLRRVGEVDPTPGEKIEWNLARIGLRVLVGGSVIALAIVGSRISGPLVGGIFAVFPAVALSTIIIAYNVKGVDFSRSIIPPFVLSMAVNISVYVLIFRVLILSSSRLAAGTLAYLVSIVSGAIIYAAMRRLESSVSRRYIADRG